jgi:preprotein translocase subunit SecA
MKVGARIDKLARRFTKDPGRHDLESYQARLEAINNSALKFKRFSESQLRDQAEALKSQAQEGVFLDRLLVDIFALVREVADRTIGLRPFEVQIVGGIGLHESKIVEMQTGEGKTLTAVAPVCLNALSGKGVHVLTFNDYLARRDAEWMGPIYRFLGLTAGFIEQNMGSHQRMEAYKADVTYLSAKEAGFDFLRDGLAYESGELVQRPFHMAVIDEADSILIDEARIPLVIAGRTEIQWGKQDLMKSVVEQLDPALDYSVDENRRYVYLTEDGAEHAERLLDCDDLYAPSKLQLLTELNLALQAQVLMKRDVDYIVRQDRVELVDDFTGRVTEDRHWPFGLQAAIESKEGVSRSEDARVLGSITIQHFLGQYPQLCGMTATAETAAGELFKFYNLDLLVVPPNRPCVRIDDQDLVFTNLEAKRRALEEEISTVHLSGRPVLVGTVSVEESESLAQDLKNSGIECNVLNAKRDDQEARIIAEAGDLGAVTISTNMAGRGTDIKLGGHSGKRYDQVRQLGGLYVLCTNRQESLRIDNQLRGRAGRQGDPGSSRFFISLEDDLMARSGFDDRLPKRWRADKRMEPADNPLLSGTVARAQRVLEGQNSDIRHGLWRYSRIVERQRSILSKNRRQVLLGTVRVKVIQERAAEARERACHRIGEPDLRDIERRLMLESIDHCWSQHLELVTDIREGIHLAEVGGLDPLIEFQKEASLSFEQVFKAIDDRVVANFNSLKITSDGIDLARMGLRGPSSTWTYLVSDDAMRDRLAATLVSQRHIGFAAGAALTWPLLILWPLIRRFDRRSPR